MKRKLEELVSNLSQLRDTKHIHSPIEDAPSPTSSSGTDLELPDAFALPVDSMKQPGKPSFGMDLDSRITSFLAGGSQTLAVRNAIFFFLNCVFIFFLFKLFRPLLWGVPQIKASQPNQL